MKKKIIIAIVTVAISLLAFSLANAQVSTLNFFKKIGNNVNFIQSTWELGSSSVRVAKGWFTNLDATNATIGTLQISSSIDPGPLSVAVATNPTIRFKTDTDSGISWNSDNNISLMTGGTNRLTVNTSGNVGIGTATPIKALEVIGSIKASSTLYVASSYWSSNGNDIFLNAGTTGQTIYLRPNGDASSVGAMNIAASGVHKFFNSSGTEQVRFNNGNVGIGTSDVRQKLHVKQSGASVGDTTDSVPVGLLIDAKNNVLSNPSLSLVGTNSNGYNTESRIELIGDEYTNYSSALAFKFRTGGTTLSERMRISANGNVGIGTTNPVSTLHIVNPNATGSDALSVRSVITGANSAVSIFNNAIHTGGGYVLNIQEQNASSISNTIYASNAGSGAVVNIAASGTGPGLIVGGNVGIGTTGPTDKLDINSNNIRIRTAKTPASATEACDQGEMSWDDTYVYVCIATNTWKRSALTTW